MKYYKDKGDGFYSVSDGVQPLEDWMETTEAEWLAHNPSASPGPDQQFLIELAKKINRESPTGDHIKAVQHGSTTST